MPRDVFFCSRLRTDGDCWLIAPSGSGGTVFWSLGVFSRIMTVVSLSDGSFYDGIEMMTFDCCGSTPRVFAGFKFCVDWSGAAFSSMIWF